MPWSCVWPSSVILLLRDQTICKNTRCVKICFCFLTDFWPNKVNIYHLQGEEVHLSVKIIFFNISCFGIYSVLSHPISPINQAIFNLLSAIKYCWIKSFLSKKILIIYWRAECDHLYSIAHFWKIFMLNLA